MANVDFSINFNVLGAPNGVFEELSQRFACRSNGGPIPVAFRNLEVLSREFGVDARRVMLVGDMTDALTGILATVAPRRVGTFFPTFWQYAVAADRAGAELASFGPTVVWEPDDPSVRSHLGACDAAIIAQPSNPTGQLVSRDDLERLIDGTPNCHFIVDETYLPFRVDYRARTALPLLDRYENLTVVTSLSNVLGVPGVQLGFAAGSFALAERLREVILPYGFSRAAETVLDAVARTPHFLDETRSFYEHARGRFRSQLISRVPDVLRLRSSSGNFFFAEIVNGWDSQKLAAWLLEREIVIRPGIEFGRDFDRFVRFAVRTPRDNERFVEALRTRRVPSVRSPAA